MRKIYTVLFVIGIVGLQFILSWIFVKIFNVETKEKVNFLVHISIDIAFFIAFVSLYFFARKFNNQYLGKSVPKVFLYIFLLILLWLFSNCLSFSSFLMCDLSEMLQIRWSNRNNELNYSLIRMILIGPVLEEFIYRKYLFNYLTTSRKQIPFSIIITSLLFSLVHLHFDYFLYYFLGGILLSLIYLHSRTIIVPIIVHILMNILTLFLLSN